MTPAPTWGQAKELRDCKLQDAVPGNRIVRLDTAIQTFLPTSLVWESVFSAANETNQKSHKWLHVKSLLSLLFVNLNGSALEKFNPIPILCCESWIKACHWEDLLPTWQWLVASGYLLELSVPIAGTLRVIYWPPNLGISCLHVIPTLDLV